MLYVYSHGFSDKLQIRTIHKHQILYCIYLLPFLFSGSEIINFSLRGTRYQNNSVVILEDIGEGYNALLCGISTLFCCRSYTRNWFFPNGTRIPTSGLQWEFYSDYMSWNVVRMHRRRGGVNGIYRCEIDLLGTADIQTLYIGVYTANTSEWYM